MNKLIALVLSISLIFGSITPSLAQSNKLMKGAQKALQTTGKEVVGGVTLPKAVEQTAGISAANSAKSALAGAPAVTGGIAGMPEATGATTPATVPQIPDLSVRVEHEIEAQLKEHQATTPKTLAEINKLLQQKGFALNDAKEIYKQIFNVPSRTNSAKEFLLLNTFPAVTVERGFAVSAKQAALAADFYRRTLLADLQINYAVPSAAEVQLDEFLAHFSGNTQMDALGAWSKAMAAVSNLGFYGSAADAPLLLSVYEHSPDLFKPVTEVVVGRALLNLGAYDALGQLAGQAASNVRLSGPFWKGLDAYAKKEGLHLNLPAFAEIPTQSYPKLEEVLTSWNGLNARHLDPSAEATAKWISLNEKKGKIIADPVAATAPVEGVAAAARPLAMSPVQVSLDGLHLPDALALGSSPIPSSSGEGPDIMPSVPGDPSTGEGPGGIIARVNSRYANVSYTKPVSQALQYGLEKAERKYIQEYGKTPVLDDKAFQKLWVESVRPELEKLASSNRKLSAKVQNDVISTLEASFDPNNVITPIEKVSIFKKMAQYFHDRADRAAAAKANRAAMEASIQGLEVTYPASLESAPGAFIPQDYEVKFVFDSEATKKAFLNVNKLDSETFVIDSNGSLLLRAPSGAVRGMMSVQIEGGNAATKQVFRVLSSHRLAPRFEAELAKGEDAVMDLLTEVRVPLRTILPSNVQDLNPELKQFLVAKDLESAKAAFRNTGKVMGAAKAVSAYLKEVAAKNPDSNQIEFKLFTDPAGDWALKLTAFSEGLSSFGQAISAATKVFGSISSFLTNLPSSAGQFGPALAPFISGLQSKMGLKHTAYLGQALSAAGLGVSAASLALGATGVFGPMAAFAGMVGGILINGIAGNGIIKQTNSPIAKAIANDPVSASSTVADLNSWASAGGIYCYLFLPVVGAVTTALFGTEVGLGTLAAMFGLAAGAPVVASGLMKASKITNIKEASTEKNEDGTPKTFLQSVGDNLKFAFTGTQKQELEQLINKKAAKKGVAPETIKPTAWMKAKSYLNQYLVQMAGRVGLYHFGGMVFNSGPGTVLKEVFAKPEQAMLASFLAVYLTVFAGRKIGAKAMGKGWITDKALIGLSSLVAVGAGAASILPGLDIYTRSGLWALAGLGFANLANQEQAMALNRPENADKKAAVSMIYVLARLTGMGTIIYGMLSDKIASLPHMTMAEGAIYGLALPVAATLAATLWNKNLITKDLRDQFRMWMTRKPKVLNYPILRSEVESAITNNPNLGVSLEIDNASREVIKNLGDGLMSRYRVDLKELEQTMISVNDKAALDLHRLEMARKLYSRLPENTQLATGKPLTYEQFRAEVEPLYNSIVKARATGASEASINKLINDSLTGIMAKYPVGRADVRVIEARLMEKTRLDRVRIATMKYIYSKQLTKEAESEIAAQLKKVPADTDKQEVINHVLEKYQAMAKARGVNFILPPNAVL